MQSPVAVAAGFLYNCASEPMTAENFTLLQSSDEPSLQESLFQLYASLLRKYIEPAFGWDEQLQRKRFRREYPPGLTSLLHVHSEEAGFMVATSRPKSLHVSLLLVRPEFQGCGLGSAVMRQILHNAETEQLPVTLCCFRSNIDAVRFYENLGFVALQEDEFFLTLTSARPPLG